MPKDLNKTDMLIRSARMSKKTKLVPIDTQTIAVTRKPSKSTAEIVFAFQEDNCYKCDYPVNDYEDWGLCTFSMSRSRCPKCGTCTFKQFMDTEIHPERYHLSREAVMENDKYGVGIPTGEYHYDFDRYLRLAPAAYERAGKPYPGDDEIRKLSHPHNSRYFKSLQAWLAQYGSQQ